MIKLRKKGITLIELIMTISISAIILTVMTTMFVSDSKIFQKIDMNSELQLQAKEVELVLNNVSMESAGAAESQSSDIENELILKDVDDLKVNHIFELEDNELIYYRLQTLEDGSTRKQNEKILGRYVKSFSGSVDSASLTYTIVFEIVQGAQTDEYVLNNRIVFRND